MFEVVYFNAIEIKLIVTKINLPEAVSLNKRSCSAAALGVTKFIVVTDMILVALCCATLVGLKCSTTPPQIKSKRNHVSFYVKFLLPTAFKIWVG
jgi:hypothetical protein